MGHQNKIMAFTESGGKNIRIFHSPFFVPQFTVYIRGIIKN
jgi:hypothetical protein